MKFPVYLDNQATTPVDPRVVDAMLPYLQDKFGNVGSAHLCGRDVVGPVAVARQQVAELLGSKPRDVVFTSGATESDNLAIKGVASARRHEGRHIITQVTEHKAVLETCEFLEGLGFEITYLDVDAYGRVDPDDVRKAIRKGAKGTTDRTILASIMGANNEIGTIQPLKEIGDILHDCEVIFHIDAAQMVSKVPFDVEAVQADLVSLSAHKMYGPKGIGALYVRSGVPMERQMHGGGQERGFRAGTLAVPMVVALGEACRLASGHLATESNQLQTLRDHLENRLMSELSGVRLNGHPSQRVPGNLNVSFEGVDGERLMLELGQICCSATSACSSTSPKPSHVLLALGLEPELAAASVRFGLGRFNTMEEVDYAAHTLLAAVKKLRG